MTPLYSHGASVVRIFLCLLMTGCAYRWGTPDRTLPGGYKQVYIPIFKNYTQEPGIEVSFTNSIKQEFERSKIARVSEASQAEVEISGEIAQADYAAGNPREAGPLGTVIATQYSIAVVVKIQLLRRSDHAVLWEGTFNGGRTYIAPQVTQPGLNTVNPLYNLSARRQNIDVIALSLMSEAHDRLTENF